VIRGGQNLKLIFDLALGEISMTLPGEGFGDGEVVSMSSYVQSGFMSPFPITLNVCGETERQRERERGGEGGEERGRRERGEDEVGKMR
jgi:hypothetical protein